jgi:hypothetical protein
MSGASSKGKEPKNIKSDPTRKAGRDAHLINRHLPIAIEVGRLVLGLVRAAVANGERGDPVRV